MNGTGVSRALLVGPAFFGLGSPLAGGGALAVRFWSEGPDGRTRGQPAVEISMAGIGPDSGPAGGQAIAAFDAAFDAYRFGLHDYDPFESLSSSLDRAATDGAPLSLALWAAMEADLFSFAFDRGFTDALDSQRGSADWLRFARLNDLYRACIRAIAPIGIVPSGWSSWLRDDKRAGYPRGGFIEKALTRRVESLATTLRRRAAAGPGTVAAVPGLKVPPHEPILEARYRTE